MYLKELDLRSLFFNGQYEKVSTYANVKRAQVTLVEEMSRMNLWDECKILCMHPGWVETDGLKEALPIFTKIMKNKLRNPNEGADTIIWLLLTEMELLSGGFYFDRQKVSAYLSKKYYPTKEQRAILLSEVESLEKKVLNLF